MISVITLERNIAQEVALAVVMNLNGTCITISERFNRRCDTIRYKGGTRWFVANVLSWNHIKKTEGKRFFASFILSRSKRICV